MTRTLVMPVTGDELDEPILQTIACFKHVVDGHRKCLIDPALKFAHYGGVKLLGNPDEELIGDPIPQATGPGPVITENVAEACDQLEVCCRRIEESPPAEGQYASIGDAIRIARIGIELVNAIRSGDAERIRDAGKALYSFVFGG